MTEEILNEHRTKNLMLLIGTNPLPNFVAARLLSKEETKLHLVVTDEVQKMGIPERLLRQLGKDPSDQSQYLPVKAVNPQDIFSTVSDRVKHTPGSWGLHYTGGTKVMATHAYRGLEHALADPNPARQGVYSYLDADSLEMVIEQAGKRIRYCSSKLDEPVMLWQLMELHGKPEATIKKARWETYSPGAFDNRPLREKPQRVPFQPELCEALKTARLNGDKDFIDSKVRELPNLARETAQRQQDVKEWMCQGFWLEHYLLDRLIHLEDECHINDYALGFEAHIFEPIDWDKDVFESDVIVIQNYRLFYFSVTTGQTKKNNKLKLFEAYMRAQQLGGEQARTALVTLFPEPERLQRELYDERHIQVRVFGPEHLEDTHSFDDYLKDWMKWSD